MSQESSVARALVDFSQRVHEEGIVQSGASFTDLDPADELIRTDPNAFLLGVLFTQGIRAERAWAGPYLLRERLGHLDLARIAREAESVATAVESAPALHRFVKTLPAWISSAARRLLADYHGDASNIWPEGSRVLDVVCRLVEFHGIGQKKAAMAAELLSRHLGAKLIGLEDGTIAYDVHVRRVFIRSGLALEDSPEEVRRAAREANPSRPGSLDLPAWLIGREWCRPFEPRCESCPLGAECPRKTHLRPSGVGARR